MSDQQNTADQNAVVEPLKEIWVKKSARKIKGVDKQKNKSKKSKCQVQPKIGILEWRRVRGTSNAEAQKSSNSEASESSDDPPKIRDQEVRRNRTKKWIPKPTCEMSSEASEGNSSDDEREFIYTQVCHRINQLTLELDKLCTASPACESFI